MRFIVRSFFRLVSRILAPVMILGEWLLMPKGIQRADHEQARVDSQTRALTLYQFRTCPFCIKVRLAVRRMSLNLSTRDVLHDPDAREELRRGGGEVKVPCLRISPTEGADTWLYESDDIIAYLESRFAGPQAVEPGPGSSG